MQRVLRSLRVMPLAAAMLMSAAGAYGQDADADKAAEMLNKGMQQVRGLDYASAKATLLQVDRSRLPDAQRTQLDETLRGLDSAIKRQLAANDAYLAGEKALAARDFQEASRQFRTVASSPYVTTQRRAEAQTELGRIEARMSVLAAAQEKPAKPAVGVKATPRVEGAVVAAAAVKPLPAPKAVAAPAPRPAPAPALTPAQEKYNMYMALGKAALNEGDGLKAKENFLLALKAMPDDEQATMHLNQALTLSDRTAGTKIVNDVVKMRRVAWTTAVVEMEKALQRSRQATRDPQREVDFDNASKEATVAQSLLAENKGYCDSADEYRGWEARVRERQRDIELRKAEWLREQATLAGRRSENAERDRVMRVERARREQIDELTRRAKTMIAEQNYDGAVQTLMEITRLDPGDRWAAYQLESAKREAELRRQRDIVTEDSEQVSATFQDIRKSEIPWYLEIVYPSDWRQKTLRRKGYARQSGAEDEKSKITRQKLQTTPVRMEFEGQDLGFIVDYLRETTDLPIHVKWRALEAADIQAKTQVTIKLKNVMAEKALKVLLDDLSGTEAAKKLTYTIDEGVITISTGSDLKTRVVQRTYDIRDMLVTVPSFVGPRIDVTKLGSNSQSNQDQGIFGGGNTSNDTTNGDTSGDQGGEGSGRETRKQIIDKMLKTIKTVIDPPSWKSEGSTGDEAVGTIEIMHGQLIVTQTPANQEKLVKLLADLREAQSLQVLVESRWLTVKNGWLERIGVDIDFTFGPDVHPLGRHVVFNNNQITQDHVGFVNGMSSGAASGISDIVGNNTGITLAGQFLDDLQVDFLIQATQASRDSRVLSAPRVMLMDGQRSYITIGQQQAYISGFNPTVSENVAALQPIVSFVPTGVVLDVEATVSADRRYVTMTVRPQTSRLVELVTAFGGLVQLPTVELQDLQSTVTVPDGGTVLLGGLKSSAEQEREIGVPILSKVPIVNRLFTNRGKVRDAETLLILVSPKIIIHKEMEELRFPPPTLPTASLTGGL